MTRLCLYLLPLLSLVFLTALNQKEDLPSLTSLPCVSYDPMYAEWTSLKKNSPVSPAIIRRDLARLKGFTSCIRIYRLSDGLDIVPEIAGELGLSVLLSVHVTNEYDSYHRRNLERVDAAIAAVNRWPSISHLLIGNEVLHFKRLTPQELLGYVRRAKEKVRVPVGIADVSFSFFRPELRPLFSELDFFGVHIFPHWMNVPYERALEFFFKHLDALAKAHPNKKILVTEIGMPSGGLPSKARVWPSVFRQAEFTRNLAAEASRRNIFFNYMEAFDQPWKATDGIAGANEEHQGLFTVDGEKKFPWEGPVETLGELRTTMLRALLIFLLFSLFFLRVRLNALTALGVSAFLWILALASELYFRYAWKQITYHALYEGIFLFGYLTFTIVLVFLAYETAVLLSLGRNRET